MTVITGYSGTWFMGNIQRWIHLGLEYTDHVGTEVKRQLQSKRSWQWCLNNGNATCVSNHVWTLSSDRITSCIWGDIYSTVHNLTFIVHRLLCCPRNNQCMCQVPDSSTHSLTLYVTPPSSGWPLHANEKSHRSGLEKVITREHFGSARSVLLIIEEWSKCTQWTVRLSYSGRSFHLNVAFMRSEKGPYMIANTRCIPISLEATSMHIFDQLFLTSLSPMSVYSI